ncbi:MAG: Crp/Fnr family transcriptional regulator [Paraprevotella sp.]|nr:Crp/Fnr family transcriptional regulator [Paraprevotella sp.]
MVKKDIDKKEIEEKIAPLCDPLTNEQRDYLLNSLNVYTFKKNEPIYSEGEFPTQLMCLLSGKVKIFKNGVGGRNQIIRVIKPVEYFAYRAHFAHQEYLTAATAFETSIIGMIPMKVITKLLNDNNGLAGFFIHQLAIDLGKSDERTVNLTQKHIRGRLAESILFLKESYGVEEDGCTLSIYLSREDLANLSNMTTSNAIRTLSNFAAEKVIAIDGRKIKIIEEDKLEKISKIG